MSTEEALSLAIFALRSHQEPEASDYAEYVQMITKSEEAIAILDDLRLTANRLVQVLP